MLFLDRLLIQTHQWKGCVVFAKGKPVFSVQDVERFGIAAVNVSPEPGRLTASTAHENAHEICCLEIFSSVCLYLPDFVVPSVGDLCGDI